jgi:DNA-binding response OmpR family regulator
MPHVMIVEDDISLGAAVTMRLELMGYLVSVVRDGTDAVRRISDEAPDLVVLDVAIPGMNGLDVAETIRRDRISNCDIIIHTGTDCEETDLRALLFGCTLLKKEPGSLFTLQRLIEERLGCYHESRVRTRRRSSGDLASLKWSKQDSAFEKSAAQV